MILQDIFDPYLEDQLFDVLIVGGGPAGLVLASEFLNADKHVCILESGGLAYDQELQELNEGELVLDGFQMHRSSTVALERDRVRILGGATNHWGGMCAPFDPIDFEAREWVPNSGWPYDATKLAPFYIRANNYLQLNHTKQVVSSQPPSHLNLIDGSESIRHKKFQFSRVGNLSFSLRKSIAESKNVTLVLNATVTDIALHQKDRARIKHVEVSNLRSFPRKRNLKIKRLVLACGAIENARILLTSKSQISKGVGNNNDLVGRFFQGHGYSRRLNSIIISPPIPNLDRYQTGSGDSLELLAPTAKFQRSRQILNCWIGINAFSDDILDYHQEFFNDVANTINKFYGSSTTSTTDIADWYFRSGQCFFEQEPDKDSRITLTREIDAFGNPKVKVISKISDLQLKTVNTFYEALGVELGKKGKGRVRIIDEKKPFMNSLEDGLAKHHHGTTRMSTSSATGVCDENAQSFFVENLFFAGSSIFPTSSGTNPTMTIVATSLKLADYLKEKVL